MGLEVKVIVEINKCPQCGSTNRMWVMAGGGENGAMMCLGFGNREIKTYYNHWIDACSYCGCVYCFKVTTEPIPEEEQSIDDIEIGN